MERTENKNEERGRKEKEISCPGFTYVIFHVFPWGVELLVVGTATQRVNQPERQQTNMSQVACKYPGTPGVSRLISNDRGARHEDSIQPEPCHRRLSLGKIAGLPGSLCQREYVFYFDPIW